MLGAKENLIRGDVHVWGLALKVLRVHYVAGHHLCEDYAKREHINAAIKVLAKKDLWSLKKAMGDKVSTRSSR